MKYIMRFVLVLVLTGMAVAPSAMAENNTIAESADIARLLNAETIQLQSEQYNQAEMNQILLRQEARFTELENRIEELQAENEALRTQGVGSGSSGRAGPANTGGIPSRRVDPQLILSAVLALCKDASSTAVKEACGQLPGGR